MSEKYYIRISPESLSNKGIENTQFNKDFEFTNANRVPKEVEEILIFESKGETRQNGKKFQRLEFKKENFLRVRNEIKDEFTMDLPKVSDGTTETITLKKFNTINENFKLSISNDSGHQELDYTPQIKTYKVYIDGDKKGHMVFTKEEVKAIYDSDGDQVELSLHDDGDYLMFESNDFNIDVPFTCNVIEDSNPQSNDVVKKSSSHQNICTLVALDVDYDTYLQTGGVTQATDFVLTIMSFVSGIYDDELDGVTNLQVSYVNIWTTTDPYAAYVYDYGNMLYTFQSYWQTNFSGVDRNVAHLMTTRSNTGTGGVAFYSSSSQCNINTMYGFSAGLKTNLVNYNPPSYSWNLKVVSHELGHNFGSPHTHSCTWPGGPIDGCASSDGNCPNGPLPPPLNGKGTIMSYCHGTSYGSLLVFHPTVKQYALLPRFQSSTCFGDCVDDPDIDDSGTTVYYIINLGSAEPTPTDACGIPPSNTKYSNKSFNNLTIGDTIYNDTDLTNPYTNPSLDYDQWYNLSVTNTSIKLDKNTGQIIQIENCQIVDDGGDDDGGNGTTAYYIFLSEPNNSYDESCNSTLTKTYYSENSYSNIGIGDILYTDPELTTPITGDGIKWYLFGDTGYSVSIDGSNGSVVSFVECPDDGSGGGGLVGEIKIPIELVQNYDDMGFYTPFDGLILQKDIVNNFTFEVNENNPYSVKVYNTSDQFKNFLKLSNYHIFWGDGTSQAFTQLHPDFIQHDYSQTPKEYTITLKQKNPWGDTVVQKNIKLPNQVIELQADNASILLENGTIIKFNNDFNETKLNSIGDHNSTDFTASEFEITGVTNSKLNELMQYGSQKFVVGKKVKKYGEDYGEVTDINTQYTAYTVNNINYYDFIDGTTTFSVMSSGLTDEMIEELPITKEEILMGVVSSPEIQSAVFIERGKQSGFEAFQRLGEVDNIGDLDSYGYGFFKLTKP